MSLAAREVRWARDKRLRITASVEGEQLRGFQVVALY